MFSQSMSNSLEELSSAVPSGAASVEVEGRSNIRDCDIDDTGLDVVLEDIMIRILMRNFHLVAPSFRLAPFPLTLENLLELGLPFQYNPSLLRLNLNTMLYTKMASRGGQGC